MAFSIGENVGAYRIIEQLGQGGMATVYKAYHAALDRYVAIKVLHPAFKEDTTFVQRFNREARIVARLEHPHIVPVYDYAEHNGLAYLVMRFVEGETLKARLKKGPLSPGQIIQLAETVGSALSYAHEQGILHRDIKPSNILLTGDSGEENDLGGVFLTDFGLARIAAAGESTLSRDMMMGTPQYISPEQAKGVLDLDLRTDVYSFGVVLFELLTGRVPFSADTPYSIIHDHIFTPLPLPSSIKPDVSEPVERVLLKALAKEREDRYPDAGSLAAAVVEALKTTAATAVAHEPEIVLAPEVEPPPAEPEPVLPIPPAEETPAEPVKKKRSRRWLLVGVLAVICICLGLWVVTGALQEAERRKAETEGELPVPAVEDPLLEEQITLAIERVTQDPEDAKAHMQLAELYLQADAVPEAEDQMRQALELRPAEEGVYLQAAAYLVEEKRLEEALEALLLGREVLPESRLLRTNFAKVLWALGGPQGDPVRAEEMVREMAEGRPDSAEVYTFLAYVLINQDKLPEARTKLDQALEIPPDLPETHLVNALWYRKANQLMIARRELNAAVQLGVNQEWLRTAIDQEMDKLGE